MVTRYRPIPSQKRLLKQALAREECEEWLKQRIGKVWTAEDAEEVMRQWRRMDELAQELIWEARELR